jgi:5-methylcytosine-specific restriction endonuclease McrA
VAPRTGYPGVNWDPQRDRWTAYAWVGGKGGRNVYLGRYEQESEAVAAVAAFRAEHPKPFRDVTAPVLRCLGPCGLEKPRSEFYGTGRLRPDGSRNPSNKCKSCFRAARREYYARKRDHHKAVCARWRAENPDKSRSYRANRRARIRGAQVEPISRERVFELHNGVCGICGEPITDGRFDVDHIVPLSKGGEHSYANTQPAHPSCNGHKSARLT